MCLWFSSASVPLQAMSVFALRDINMKKLESRPLRSSPILHELDNGRRSYNYVFFIDFIGSTAEVRWNLTHLWAFIARRHNVIYVIGAASTATWSFVHFVGSTTEVGCSAQRHPGAYQHGCSVTA